MKTRNIAVSILLAGSTLAVAACDENTAPDNEVTYVIEVSTELFRVRAQGEAAAALEARRQSGLTGVISGTLVRGSGGFNAPWGWHLDPATVHVADMSTEVCDGRPSFIQADINYWVDIVTRYCPWGARVVAVE